MSNIILRLIQAATPLAMLYVGKEIIDEVLRQMANSAHQTPVSFWGTAPSEWLHNNTLWGWILADWIGPAQQSAQPGHYPDRQPAR